jgi:hypothetical protein
VLGPLKGGTDPEKKVAAICPADSRVVGGGGSVNDGGTGKVMLYELAPDHTPGPPGQTDRFFAKARTIDPQFSGAWTVTAYAICAYGQTVPKNLNVRMTLPATTEAPFKSGAIACPAGQRALSAGAVSDNRFHGRAGLQLVRTSGPRDISRATGRISQPGPGYYWALDHLAVCADPAPGFDPPVEVLVGGRDGRVTCPPGKKVYGAGGGGSLTDSGNSYLSSVIVSSDLRQVQVTMTAPPTGGMVIQAICGPAS